ncbi:hypothetical protein L2737_13565 [Shewanella electrodiphila]|uniref:Uncharacterized protein n=1 Tax=Shewanella electrodiphila TaxID=934143 RepID=A0ABT0KRC2_9GAMM|nr:hypothetical protein [Shewanella electrodiphila]MCL1046339.1 hypothetical protein [Shewanella electrodiphila]
MIEVYTKEYWLNELKESAQFLESLYRTTVWDNELEFKTEKAVFLGCYAIRKLKESKLLSTELSGFNTSLISHPIRSEHDSIVDEKWSKNTTLGKAIVMN